MTTNTTKIAIAKDYLALTKPRVTWLIVVYNGGRLFLWCKAWAVGWGDDLAPGTYIDREGIAGVGDRCAERVV